MKKTSLIQRRFASYPACIVALVAAFLLGSSCKIAPIFTNEKPDSLIFQVIPGSNQFLFQFNFDHVWGYAINDTAAKIGRNDLDQLPKGRLLVDAGGMVASDTNGVIQSLELYRIEPNPGNSPIGTKRHFFYDTYSPAHGRVIRVEQLPSRGICKRTSSGIGI